MKIFIILLAFTSFLTAAEKLKRYDMRQILNLDQKSDEKFRTVVTLEKSTDKEAQAYFNPPPTKKELEQKEAAYKKACEEAKKNNDPKPSRNDPGNTDLLVDYNPKAKKPHLYYITYKKAKYKVMADKDWKLGDDKRT